MYELDLVLANCTKNSNLRKVRVREVLFMQVLKVKHWPVKLRYINRCYICLLTYLLTF